MKPASLLAGILATLLLPTVADAAFLRDLPVPAVQPDGTPVVLFATGDEFHRRVHDALGYTVIRDPVSGWLVYADRDGGDLVPTGLAVGVSDPADAGLPPGLDVDLGPQQDRLRAARAARLPAPAAPMKGAMTNLMIFVRFDGDDELTERIEDYEAAFNSTEAGSTSLRAYFREVSRGALDITTIYTPTPDPDGWATAYTDTASRGYFCIYHAAANPTGYTSDSDAAQREHALLERALKAVEPLVPEDAVLDSDGDGLVDNVVFMVQGFPADPWASLLWPHQWEMPIAVPFRGVSVRTYNMQFTSLLVLSPGTFSHEMSHTLGAPDLYHYNQDDLTPVGPWDLMEQTASPPQHMLAYLKWRYLGFIDTIPQASHGQTVRLAPSWDAGTQAVRILAGPDPLQWFVLEYRRADGPFEGSLPASGLLAYRIDDTSWGAGNRNGPPDEVYVLRPGGTANRAGRVDLAPLGAATGRDRMNETTDPAPRLQDATPVTLRVYDVAEDSDGVSFKVCLEAPACGEATCGDDGCGGLCGLCAGRTHCVGGTCVACACDGRTCGDDGCGTSCGECDDGDPCTVDSCDDGACAHGTAADGTACDDGDPCTGDDRCDPEGQCRGTPSCPPDPGPPTETAAGDLPGQDGDRIDPGTDRAGSVDPAGAEAFPADGTPEGDALPEPPGKHRGGGCQASGRSAPACALPALLFVLVAMGIRGIGRGRRRGQASRRAAGLRAPA